MCECAKNPAGPLGQTPPLDRRLRNGIELLLYERFSNEAGFRDKFIRPLLNRLGFHGVSEQHGVHEFGKDFVFSEVHRLGGTKHYAAQVKHEKKINQGRSVDGLLTQIKQAFSTPFKRVSQSENATYPRFTFLTAG